MVWGCPLTCNPRIWHAGGSVAPSDDRTGVCPHSPPWCRKGSLFSLFTRERQPSPLPLPQLEVTVGAGGTSQDEVEQLRRDKARVWNPARSDVCVWVDV